MFKHLKIPQVKLSGTLRMGMNYWVLSWDTNPDLPEVYSLIYISSRYWVIVLYVLLFLNFPE